MTNQAPLRACPTCGTAVDAAKLGMRDYANWLGGGVLPGKVSGSDIDFVLDQASTGRMLAVEFKEGNQRVSMGQKLLFKQMRARDIEVWMVWEYDEDKDGVTDHVKVGSVDVLGEVRFSEKLTTAQFASKVKGWWYDGLTTP